LIHVVFGSLKRRVKWSMNVYSLTRRFPPEKKYT
jgi:hypothetical protein